MLPRHLLPLLALPVSLAACSGDSVKVDGDAGLAAASDAGLAASLGDGYLRSSNLVAARGAYQSALAANPTDSHAAFGTALTSLLLLPDSPAVNQLLDLCAQPHLDLSSQLFGPSGVLALDRDARRGSGTLSLSTRQGPTGDWTPVSFQAESWRTTSEAVSLPGQSDHLLRIEVRDLSFAGHQTARVVLEASYANVAQASLPPQRLTDGLVVPADQFGGAIRVLLPSADGLVWDNYSHPVSGNLVFKKVGTGTTGDAVSVELVDLELEGLPRSCNGTCDAEAWPYLKLSGALSDTISAAARLPLPFAELREDPGPPHRDPLVVLVEQCPGLSAELLREKLGGLLDELESAAGNLAAVLASPDAEIFQFEVPGGLFFVDGRIPLNITDARVFRAGLEVLVALGRGLTQYRTFARRFEELLGEYALWLDTGGEPTSRSERGFVASLLVAELNAVFLGRQPGFDLAASRKWLISALEDASLALAREPKNSGVLNFQTPNARSFAADLQAQVEFLQTSLIKPGLQGFPHSPDYRLSLESFLTSPVDLDSLHLASSDGHGVFLLRPGDPGAQWAFERNDRVELDSQGLTRALAPVFQAPVDLSDKYCDATTACPGRYTCAIDFDGASGHCQEPQFQFLDPEALRRAIPDSGDPAFLDAGALRPLEALF